MNEKTRQQQIIHLLLKRGYALPNQNPGQRAKSSRRSQDTSIMLPGSQEERHFTGQEL